MLDTHFKPENFGVMPFILGIPSYTLFVALGIIVGVIYYIIDANRREAKNEGVIIIVSAALIFGVIGSKIPQMLGGGGVGTWLLSKSIVGGLLGGMLGVILVKRLLKIKLRMGNIIAPAVALGMSIGRLGCFYNGCCYGKPAPWGVNFGDGVLRYPTQLFEVAFHLAAFVILHNIKSKVKTLGILFKYYVAAYFLFRFLMEYIRENPIMLWGMTVYQVLCLVGLLYIGAGLAWGRNRINKKGVEYSG